MPGSLCEPRSWGEPGMTSMRRVETPARLGFDQLDQTIRVSLSS